MRKPLEMDILRGFLFSTKSNAQPSQLNIGNNYEILRQDYNTNGRTTQQMPLQYNVGRGGKIPRTLKN
jgi:hypothetical protein